MVLRASLLILALLATARLLYAQSIPSDASPYSLALGQSEVAMPADEWSPNPAMRADTFSHIRTMLAPAPNNLSGTWTAGVNGDFSTDAGLLFGASFVRNEFPDIGYSWESFGIQAAKTFHVSDTGANARFASVGVRARYAEEVFGVNEPYLPLDEMTADLGATFDLFPQLAAGVTVTHLVTIYNSQDSPMEPLSALFGLSWRPLDELTVDGAVAPTDSTSSMYHFGVQYAFDQYLFLRVGTVSGFGRNSGAQISGGFGILSGTFIADFSAIRDPILGTTVTFGIGFLL